MQLAAERSGDTAPDTTEQFNQLGTEVQLAIDELRAFAQGVFPAVLGDFGPVAALKQAVRAAPVPTTVSGVNVGRYRPELERAIYFCCLEALQNTYKHAHTATAAHVRIATRGARAHLRDHRQRPRVRRLARSRPAPDCTTCTTASPRSEDR